MKTLFVLALVLIPSMATAKESATVTCTGNLFVNNVDDEARTWTEYPYTVIYGTQVIMTQKEERTVEFQLVGNTGKQLAQGTFIFEDLSNVKVSMSTSKGIKTTWETSSYKLKSPKAEFYFTMLIPEVEYIDALTLKVEQLGQGKEGMKPLPWEHLTFNGHYFCGR